jgi:TPR repeat protein
MNMHKQFLLFIAFAVIPFLAHASEESTKSPKVDVNILSDFEGGTRAHAGGNLEMAIILFRQGSEKGDPKSMFALGTYYYLGEGLAKDFNEARKLFETAADKGHAESAFMLSLIHGRGEGVIADKKVALGYLQKAAYGCVGHAQNQLAQMYYEGTELAKDELNGIAWLVLSSDDAEPGTKATARQIKANLKPENQKRVTELEKQHRAAMKCST